MIFKFALKYIFKANTESEKLRASVIYGWTLVVIGITCAFISTELPYRSSNIADKLLLITLATLILFIFRYTSVKPILGAAAAGVSVIALGAILESLFNRRDNAFSLGALIGVIFVLFFLIIKNLIISWYYLIRETIRYYQFRKHNSGLDETILNS